MATPKPSLVAEVNQRLGRRLEVVGSPSHGEVSDACFVRWSEGGPAVLTRVRASVDVVRGIGEVLDLVRSRGVPVPRYQAIVDVADGVAVVQERMPGSPPAVVDTSTVEAIVNVNDTFVGVLEGRPDIEAPRLHLDASGDGWCLHETLEQYDDRGRMLLDRILAAGTAVGAELAGDDLVHWDFVPGNILVDRTPTVTGVVDWMGVARGDARFSLMKLLFNLAFGAALRPPAYPEVRPEAVRLLRDLLRRRLDPVRFDGYWAHWALSLTDWAIRGGSPAAAEHYLTFSLTGGE